MPTLEKNPGPFAWPAWDLGEKKNIVRDSLNRKKGLAKEGTSRFFFAAKGEIFRKKKKLKKKKKRSGDGETLQNLDTLRLVLRMQDLRRKVLPKGGKKSHGKPCRKKDILRKRGLPPKKAILG